MIQKNLSERELLRELETSSLSLLMSDDMKKEDGRAPIELRGAINIHVYPSSLRNESRILKIVKTLQRAKVFDSIVVVGKWEPGVEAITFLGGGSYFHRISPLFSDKKGTIFRIIKVIVWHIRVLLAYGGNRKVVCVNCHSLPVLPLCVVLKFLSGCKLIYDTHELETEVIRSRGVVRVFYKAIERLLIRYCDKVSVVNKEISSWYENEYGISAPVVVENMPVSPRAVDVVRGTALRDYAGITDDDVLFIYQGLFSKGRGIEKLISVFSGFHVRLHLIFLGYGPLEQVVRKAADQYPCIHFHPAVPPELLSEYTASADVGIALIENLCKSYYLCLPNKLYEYVMCGVPVIASDFPVMSRVVQDLRCGWLTEPDEDSLRILIEALSFDDIEIMSRNAKKARGKIGWHLQENNVLAIYESCGFHPIKESS